MDSDIRIPYAWRMIVEGKAPLKRLYVLTALAEHPHMVGFDASAKRELLKAAAEAAAVQELDTFRVLWEISPVHSPTENRHERRSVRSALDHPHRRRADRPL
jgi:hypothetical protein